MMAIRNASKALSLRSFLSTFPTIIQWKYSQYPQHHRSLFIQAQATPNPNALKFIPGKTLLPPGESLEFSNVKAAQKSPLVSKLFQIHGVKRAMLGSDFVSISVEEGTEWSEVKPHVYAAIEDFFATGKPVLVEEAVHKDTEITDEDDEVVALIKELIETRIRPAVQEDGGDILYRDFDMETGVVQVQMTGACKGCSSSSITLKNGIENMLMHYIPEVQSVEQVEDPEEEELSRVSNEQLTKLEQGLSNIN